MITLKTEKNNKVSRFYWKIWGFTVIFFTTLVSILIFTNAYGLRTLLYLDTKIHSWSNIQNGQIIQRADTESFNIELRGRVGLLAKSVEIAVIPSTKQVISPSNYQNNKNTPSLTNFQTNVSVLPGWMKVFGRSKRGNYRRANGIEIGIGEVFIVAGQSNATGSSKTLFLSQSDNVRSGQLQEDNSIIWKKGDDPQITGGEDLLGPLLEICLVKNWVYQSALLM